MPRKHLQCSHQQDHRLPDSRTFPPIIVGLTSFLGASVAAAAVGCDLFELPRSWPGSRTRATVPSLVRIQHADGATSTSSLPRRLISQRGHCMKDMMLSPPCQAGRVSRLTLVCESTLLPRKTYLILAGVDVICSVIPLRTNESSQLGADVNQRQDGSW